MDVEKPGNGRMRDAASIERAVHDAYTAAAKQPTSKHAFPVGRRFAESIGYSQALLDTLPSVAYEAFTGVSNVSVSADIKPGSRVLDLGCGAGLDSLIAAARTGEAGRVSGVDFSEAMIDRARGAAAEAHAENVELHHGDASNLPFEDESFDVVLINGLFNLNPAREAIFRELARVLRVSGRAFVAELVLKAPRADDAPMDESNWFA